MRKQDSTKYAKALFQLATETNQIDKINRSLDKIATLFDKEDVYSFFANPFVDNTAKTDLIKNSFQELPEILLNLLFILIHRRQIHLLPYIHEKYQQLIWRSKNILPATIISAFQLEKPVLERIKNMLVQLTDKNILITQKIDKSVLGGVIIKAGEGENLVIDGSIRAKINSISQEFLK
ncbi:MAG: ATP synthase F1 subunit delta [Elusimicrobiota bacterium]